MSEAVYFVDVQSVGIGLPAILTSVLRLDPDKLVLIGGTEVLLAVIEHQFFKNDLLRCEVSLLPPGTKAPDGAICLC